MTFDLFAHRFVFEALDRVAFAESAANTFRGALGHILRRLADEAGSEAVYQRIFEPEFAGGPSGLADAPRPFVIRAASLDGRALQPGESFHLDVHVFDVRQPVLPYLTQTFEELATEGVGAARGRVRLARVEALGEGSPLRLPLDPGPPVDELTVRFITPTELKSGGRVLDDAPFDALFARARDRLSTLRALYGAGPLEIDFRAMGERAAAVRTVSGELRRTAASRRSSRTGQTHPLGGLVGEVRYAGALGEFVPFLRAAYWTGVGRQTTWGKGVIEVEL